MTIATIARPEIRDLHAYQAAVLDRDTIRLNSNEAAREIDSFDSDGLNRYPTARPVDLHQAMAGHYGVATENVLATRGSSEGIDLLIRTFCSAGRDSVLITPPVFELYRIYAAVQGANIITVPLKAARDFELDAHALLAACTNRTKLIFLCTPNNPVGSTIPREDILRIIGERAGKSVVVVDEAYIEYSETESVASLVNTFDNLVVLRTLSKAHALAGARCGAVLAAAETVQLLSAVLAPYALSSPVTARAMHALSGDSLADSRALRDQTVAERERLKKALADRAAVDEIWPSQANFLFVRLRDIASVKQRLNNAGIAIRTFDRDPALAGCARITIAAKADNQRLLDALGSFD